MSEKTDILRKYFPDLNFQQVEQFEILGSLYPEWNDKINVISRKDIEHLFVRHVLHSMAIARYIQFSENCKIMDAGTGGGFPGIPLAILFPSARFTLVDSTGKKLKVIDDIAAKLGLENIITRHSRLEEYNERFDFVVSRAVASIPQMLSWTSKNIRPGNDSSLPNGLLYLKGGDFGQELHNLGYNYTIWDLSEIFEEEFFLTKKLIHIVI